MQIEFTLAAEPGADYAAQDLGFLLHKHPERIHERSAATGKSTVFFSRVSDETTTAVLHLNVDPVGLVRGRNAHSDGLMDQYVNDRPYVANSFLSVAMGRSFGQTMGGRSKERQHLADRLLPLSARVIPVGAVGGADMIAQMFQPLGYQVIATPIDDDNTPGADLARRLFDLTISGTVRLADLMNHLYVLVPVLDNAKHWWIDREEIDKLLTKGEGWLADHPARELIAKRALKNRRSLVHKALERLSEETEKGDEASPDTPRIAPRKSWKHRSVCMICAMTALSRF